MPTFSHISKSRTPLLERLRAWCAQRSFVEAFAENIARHVIIPKAGHFVPEEQSEALLEELKPFFDSWGMERVFPNAPTETQFDERVEKVLVSEATEDELVEAANTYFRSHVPAPDNTTNLAKDR
jgi:hypothetical protein